MWKKFYMFCIFSVSTGWAMHEGVANQLYDGQGVPAQRPLFVPQKAPTRYLSDKHADFSSAEYQAGWMTFVNLFDVEGAFPRECLAPEAMGVACAASFDECASDPLGLLNQAVAGQQPDQAVGDQQIADGFLRERFEQRVCAQENFYAHAHVSEGGSSGTNLSGTVDSGAPLAQKESLPDVPKATARVQLPIACTYPGCAYSTDKDKNLRMHRLRRHHEQKR